MSLLSETIGIFQKAKLGWSYGNPERTYALRPVGVASWVIGRAGSEILTVIFVEMAIMRGYDDRIAQHKTTINYRVLNYNKAAATFCMR